VPNRVTRPALTLLYYFFPEDSDAWRIKNYTCVYVFWPLNKVDQRLGLGRCPASEPLWGLSK
jgi:hypothetical protein